MRWHVSNLLDKRIPDHQKLLELEGQRVIFYGKQHHPARESLEWRLDRLLKGLTLIPVADSEGVSSKTLCTSSGNINGIRCQLRPAFWVSCISVKPVDAGNTYAAQSFNFDNPTNSSFIEASILRQMSAVQPQIGL